jgi:predicted RND superfamily exporter protein
VKLRNWENIPQIQQYFPERTYGSSALVHLRSDGRKGWEAWVFAREEQWHGIVYSDVIIAAGFAIFVLSDFPPTQRFGLAVLASCVIDILANLLVLPPLGGRL